MAIKPGIHPDFEFEHYGADEITIINKIKTDFLLTYSGKAIQRYKTEYPNLLAKPTDLFTEAFNVDREIICVFSPNADFQPRVLDIFDIIRDRLTDLRTENVCRILISRDAEIETKITDLLKNDPEQPIVIPFTYDELMYGYNDHLIRNRFRKHFYTRDLFSFLSPLKKDLYFFGRTDLIQQIVNKHRSGEHTGLFGLRKSGKTSIIYAVERLLQTNGELFLSIDCESPSIHMLRWNELLEKIVKDYSVLAGVEPQLEQGRYQEKLAADSFASDILDVFNRLGKKPVLMIFDEIERVTPDTGSSAHWREGNDFIYFWQTLRGFYQRNPEVLTYMLVGTNPNCVEKSIICDQENPIFGSIPSQYVPPFSVEQVRQMVRKLGKYMGLRFDEILYGKLTEDFGGHPFLIRLVCSCINKKCTRERPADIDKAIYAKAKTEFSITETAYLEMILDVLKKWYRDEYDMLCFLALEDMEVFERLAVENKEFTRHLIGYGIINYSNNGYSFNIESIKEYLKQLHKFEKTSLTDEEKIAEISLRRNRIEKKIRSLVRQSLKIRFGQVAALEKVKASLPENRRSKIKSTNIDEILHKDYSPLFFLELINVIDREWDVFGNIFPMEKTKVIFIFKEINECGRPDAHAKSISNDDFEQLRLYFKKIETVIETWEV